MSVVYDGVAGVAEQERNAPYSRKRHNDIDYPADNAVLSAADKTDEIELENAYAAPIQSADDQKRQRYFI